MPIKIGTKNVSKIMLGTKNVTKAYTGNILIPGIGGLPTLPYTPYVILIGDSMPTGNAATDIAATVAAYNAQDIALRNRIKAVAGPVTNQQFNGWMMYTPATPGTVAGTGFRAGVAQANPGPEIGLIEKFLAAYSNDLYVIKDTLPGSYQGTQNLGTFLGSISGSVLTTSVTNAVKASDTITGPGVPVDTYVANGSGTAYNLGILGSTAIPSIAATGTITMNKFNGGLSWKKGASPIYTGFNRRIVGGVRQHLVDAIAAVPGTPLCIGILYWLGTNDKADSALTTEFAQNVTDFLNQLVIDVPQLSGVKITWPEIRGGSSNANTVIGVQNSLKASPFTNIRIVRTSTYPLIDGTHFNIENGYRQVGQDWFKVIFENYAGIVAGQ